MVPAPDGVGGSSPIAQTAASNLAGANLTTRLKGIDWRANNHTLLLVISTHCHFCTESAPFFRRLDREAQGHAKIVAVLPEALAEADSYLKREGVTVDDVKTASLESLGVNGTPTMLLVDSNGVVISTWVGKIKPEEENAVLETLRIKGSVQKRG